jgi:hypothetical protein
MPAFYQTPWTVSALMIRGTACFFGSLVAGVLWPKGRYAVTLGLVAAYLAIDMWSISSFHIFQPWDENASGWAEIPVLTKVRWIASYVVATSGGSVIGHPAGVAIRNWFSKAWISPSEKSPDKG